MKYDLKKRIFLVKKFYQFQSYAAVQSEFRKEFKIKKAPGSQIIKNLVRMFEKTGSVAHKRSERTKPSPKREEAKNQLENLVSKFPNLTIRKAASAINISTTLVYSILHDDLHLKPYKYHDWHKLEHYDYQRRLDFAHWFLSLPANTKFSLICCDEAYFYLTLPINKQNNRIWAQSQPHQGIEIPLHDEKILVWCAISADKIYGAHYFENAVNQHNYLEMLQTFFWPKHLRTANYQKYYFQQDSATPHAANNVQMWLTSKFSNRFIDKGKWPPRSPDLNPCDFFLWGYLKQKVYNPLPKTIDQLKTNLEREIKKITRETLNSVFLEFEKRCHLIISAEGGHIEMK